MKSVTKADGTKQVFDKQKVINTLLRMRLNPKAAEEVAKKIESRIYEGIPTKKILQMIFNFAKQYRPELAEVKDLREAISLLRPKPDFEHFVGLLLMEYGYDIKMNKIIPGKCVEHEIDVIASKGKENIFVEVKHHFQHHTYTGLDVFLEANSTFEDLADGYKLNKHDINFTRALVISNTKISDHAKNYSTCRKIMSIAWKHPERNSLEDMIENKKLYPITFLKGLDKFSQETLGDAGIVLVKQLVEEKFNEILKRTKISKLKLKELILKAQKIMSSS